MEHRNPYRNLSPLDHRYWNANKALFEQLSDTLSEQAVIKYLVRAEAALLKIHIERHIGADSALLKEVDGLEEVITPQEVFEEEQVTHHNIRALVHVIQRHLPAKLAPWVHLGATSADILDTAAAMRIRDAMNSTILPLILDLLDILTALGDKYAALTQIGRTHGQAAVPITFGFAMAEYAARIGQSAQLLKELSCGLRGKLSGAVGAYNAMSLIAENPLELEQAFLESLGLQPAEYSNQIVEPEHLLRLLLELNVCFGIIANLADDLRHLQRTEIAEVGELFGEGQVGSSTMPHKRNPWNSEHVKSLWKVFSPRVITFYMDQISEHQRDLSNSASSRFVADYLAGFSAAAARMKTILASLGVDEERMKANLISFGGSLLAEPSYIILALSGHSDAHENLRRATLEAHAGGTTLKEVLRKDTEVWSILDRYLNLHLGMDADAFYSSPAAYIGMAEKKTRLITAKYQKISQALRKSVGGE
ncbi:MAG: adenylosuccinate lyase [Spirochaeta sp. LUC14_002_19_P3]|nr:MAG: adenylosuccinate lyase [Spirochaeta sp. LUC14_002_19_P3]